MRLRAAETRESFVGEVGQFLEASRCSQKLKERVNDLQKKVGVVGKGAGGTVEGGIRESGNTGEGEAGEGGQVSGEGEQEGAVLSEGQLQEQREQREQLFFLYDLEDESLMHIFSYLDTVEVLHIAQVCKFVLVRVDRLFGIESSVIQPEWETRPTAADRQLLLQAQAQAQAQAEIQAQAAIQAQKQIQGQAQGQGGGQVGPADPILSKEIIDVLIKKLTAAELKVILSIAERSKKQGAQIDNLSAEKEDISARLQNTESVRNFLIEKLKAAEVEIKSLMGTNSALKRQGKSDEEIIGYLDLRANELESHKQDLSGRANQLQASLDLSQASHSHREAQLSSELSDWKLKYEKLDVNFKAQKVGVISYLIIYLSKILLYYLYLIHYYIICILVYLLLLLLLLLWAFPHLSTCVYTYNLPHPP
ncbi:hypothetical protein B484DRAFT_146668 [Ochromonadaceae sp. CCMP2298]|nr:hypothetical protein B484DRAFT_146668 [Ochromonadaceae sp. CCMP2298]